MTGAGLPDESNEFDEIDVLMDTKIHQNEFSQSRKINLAEKTNDLPGCDCCCCCCC